MKNRKLWMAILAGAMAAIMLLGLIFGLLASAFSADALAPGQTGLAPEAAAQAAAAIDVCAVGSPRISL